MKASLYGITALLILTSSFAASASPCTGRLPDLFELAKSVACGKVTDKELGKLQSTLRKKLVAKGYTLTSEGEAFVLSGEHHTTLEEGSFPNPSGAAFLDPDRFTGQVWQGYGEVRNTEGFVLGVGESTDYEWPNEVYDADLEVGFSKNRCLRAVKRAISDVRRCL